MTFTTLLWRSWTQNQTKNIISSITISCVEYFNLYCADALSFDTLLQWLQQNGPVIFWKSTSTCYLFRCWFHLPCPLDFFAVAKTGILRSTVMKHAKIGKDQYRITPKHQLAFIPHLVFDADSLKCLGELFPSLSREMHLYRNYS